MILGGNNIQVQRVSYSTTFGNLYIGESVKNLEKDKKSSKGVLTELKTLKKLIHKNKLDKEKNVDIILHHEKDNFYGVISSKTEGTPMNPAYRCNVSSKKSTFEKFKEWTKAWNEAFSPEALNDLNEVLDVISRRNIKK